MSPGGRACFLDGWTPFNDRTTPHPEPNMFLKLRPLLRRLSLLLALPLLAVLAAAHEGQDYLFEQDFDAAPPQLDGLVESWINWLGHGEYERTGGQPFAGSVPPGLPPEVTDIYLNIEGGSTQRSGGCVYTWHSRTVWIQFSDGSSFFWWSIHTELDCPGSVEVFDNVIASGGIEDPVTGSWSGWVRSYSKENLQVQRRASLRGSATSVADLSSLSLLSMPLVGTGHGDVDVTFAPGGVLDLRGYNGSGGRLFETDLPITLRCDSILLDPGVQISDLISPAPIQLPGTVVHELALLGGSPVVANEGPSSKRLWVSNFSNAPGPVSVDWIDVLGWSFGGPILLPLAPLQSSSLQMQLLVPPGVPAGTESPVQVSLQAGASQTLESFLITRAQNMAPGPQIYCLAKQNSLGCLPAIATSGAPSLTGYDDFVMHATDVLLNKFGVAFYGSAPAQLPFQGGLLCVQPPLKRTAPRLSVPLNSGVACDGWYSYHFSQESMINEGFAPGTTLNAQWWSRDPADPFGTGLSNAVSFTVGP